MVDGGGPSVVAPAVNYASDCHRLVFVPVGLVLVKVRLEASTVATSVSFDATAMVTSAEGLLFSTTVSVSVFAGADSRAAISSFDTATPCTTLLAAPLMATIRERVSGLQLPSLLERPLCLEYSSPSLPFDHQTV